MTYIANTMSSALFKSEFDKSKMISMKHKSLKLGYNFYITCFVINSVCNDNDKSNIPTVCPRSSDPFYILSYYIKCGTTSSTYSILELNIYI